MRGSLLFSAATAALLMFASGAAAQEADPPGDSSTQASFTGAAIESEISPGGDVDWYRMQVEQGQRYSFTLDGIANEDGVALDPMLGVYDAEGNQLAFNDDSNMSLNAALRFTPEQSGEIFVEARGFSEEGTGRYRLAATSASVPPDDAGNDAGTSARVTPGRPVTGELEYEGDVDWYRLSVRTGQRYRITLDGAEGADVPLGDPFLRVIDGEGIELAVGDDTEMGLNAAIELVPTSSGDVFVEARGYADAYAGVYTLNVAAERLPRDNLSGDRNTRGRIAVGESVDSSIDFPTDVDWHRVRLEGGQSYRFTLVGSGGSALGDPLLRVHGADGAELAMNDDGGGSLNSYLEFAAPSTGNYFLAAAAFADAGTGGYTLSALAGDVPGDASTDQTLSSGGDWRAGVLSPEGDRDWYRIDLEEGQAFRLSLEGAETGDPLGDPYLVLYGPDGAEVARDDDGGEGLNALLEYQAAVSGPHYAEARGFTGEAQGAYAIALVPGEIGDSADAADYLMAGPEGRSSVIGVDGDVDWFLVEMIEGRPYRFNLIGDPEGGLADPTLVLYDAQGAQVASDDDGGTGVNSYLTFMSATGGSYFAAVSSYGNTGTGRYWLSASDTDVPGNAYTDENLDSGGDDRISRIDMEGDRDSYRVGLEAGVTYMIEVNGHGDAPLADPVLAVLNEAEEQIASDDDSGDGRNARLRFSPEQSGTYTIQASGLGGSIGWYQISIVRQ